jgi:LysM repeat protein
VVFSVTVLNIRHTIQVKFFRGKKMIIHRVDKGDSIFKIAKKYGVSKDKIAENNDLGINDSLCVGEELLILKPLKEYVANKGDTVKRVAKRFNTSEREIYRCNPNLHEAQRIDEGENLAIRYQTVTGRSAIVLGKYTKKCTEQKLLSALCRITFLAIECAFVYGRKIHKYFEANSIIETALKFGVKPILSVESNENLTDGSINEIVDFAVQTGFKGIMLTIDQRVRKDLVFSLRHKLINLGMSLFLEIDCKENFAYSSLCECAILKFSKFKDEKTLSFYDGEYCYYSDFANSFAPQKALIDISYYLERSNEIKEHTALAKLVKKTRKLVLCNEEENTNSVVFNANKNNEVKVCNIKEISLENTKARLDLIDKLGFMGAFINIEDADTRHLMILSAFFDTLYFDKTSY